MDAVESDQNAVLKLNDRFTAYRERFSSRVKTCAKYDFNCSSVTFNSFLRALIYKYAGPRSKILTRAISVESIGDESSGQITIWHIHTDVNISMRLNSLIR